MNDLYYNNDRNLFLSVNNANGQLIPANNYTYLKFDEREIDIVKIDNAGKVTYKKAGFYLIVMNLVIAELFANEFIDFIWNSELGIGTYTRCMGLQGNYARKSFSTIQYFSAGFSDIPVLFNRNNSDKKAAMSTIAIMYLPSK